jgi:hypothetical protein
VKKNLLTLTAILATVFSLVFSGCAKKGIQDPVTLDKASGKWTIHAIRYRIFDGPTTSKDSTIPWRPIPENFVSFDGVSSLQYCFNSTGVLGGDYSFIGSDSISIRVDHKTTRWKILLLTGTNFNIESTSANNPDFPGATVVTYQGFIR